MSKKQFVFFLLVCCFQVSRAQINPPVKTEPAKDSARMYKSIEKFSKKSKFTKFIHGLIFEPIRTKNNIAKASPKKVPKKNYRQFEGKIIRHINVETLDPFGYSEKNTTSEPTKYLSKVGNRIHLKSKALTIKNLLLIKRNRPLDSLLVKESERLVRSQRFVRGVVITPVLISKTSDSVDVNIRVLDSWSLIPDIAGSNSKADFDLTERNFLGLGHQFENTYQRKFNTGEDAYSTRYTTPNILNTYIKTSIAYQIDLEHNYSKSINIERPFFSPFTRWAAGVYFDQQFRSDTLQNAINVYARQFFKYDSQDYWAGHSIQIFKGNTENDRTTNLINTFRYLNVNYTESPEAGYDSIHFYADEKFYLAGIGLSSRQFVEDKYIFNNGVIEDVPVGRSFGITGGWQEKNNVGRPYIGARVSLGKFYKWGYLSSNFEYGTFFSHSISEQSAFSAQANYFTNLMESGKWKFRQFVKSRFVLGNNRLPSRGDQLTINDRNGIPGFNPVEFYGTRKFIMTFQSQAYSPWNLGGFRMNPYLSYSIGLLGDSKTGFSKSRLYSQIGAGFIITNDYLVFSSFQLSIAYYPNIPGNGDNIFKTNAFNTEDFGFQDFEVSKPRTVDYQ
jgi:hypothetical protein